MSLTNSPFWMAQTGGASFYDYEIENSFRLNWNANHNLSRTPASAGNRQTFTVSFWWKRGRISNDQPLFGWGNTNQNTVFAIATYAGVSSWDIYDYDNGTDRMAVSWSNQMRDPSAWYHIVLRIDTTQATASNRVRLYINGEAADSSGGRSSYPSQNLSLFANNNTATYVARDPYNTTGSGYYADVNFIDGQSLDPTSFAETKSGIWVPKEYTGSYGTNGYFLKFQSSAALGTDSSGNANNFTVNNATSHDQTTDTPTNNFSNISPLTGGSISWVENGNLQMRNGSGADAGGIASTFGMPAGTGKWYWEIFMNNPNVGDNYPYVGVCANQRLNKNATYGTNSREMSLNCGTGGLQTDTTYVGSITSVGTGLTRIEDNNILGVAVDMENRKMWFSENGVFPNSGNPATGANPTFTWTNDVDLFPHWFSYSSYGSGSVWNFGQEGTFAGNKTAQGNSDDNGVGNFYYAPPSGFLAMCTANLPAPGIDPAADASPTDYFNTVLYSGNGSTNAITGVGFGPEFCWAKSRNLANSHRLIDIVRGDSILNSDLTDAENTGGDFTFDSDGITWIGAGPNANDSGKTFVLWSWLAGGTGVSNTDGSITSTVSANQDAGFSVVTYTGNGTNSSTVGHGLSSAPEFVIVKSRSNSRNWVVEHNQGLGMYLNLTNDGASAGPNTMTQQSSTIRFDDSSDSNRSVNFNSETYVAYCFHSVDGFSKVGSYVGNGSSDGPMIVTGFRPAWVMVKAYSSTGGWTIFNSDNSNYNLVDSDLSAEDSRAEATGSTRGMDWLSNGFKLRSSFGSRNGSGVTYIYLAFAEQPFKYANAR